MTLREYLDAVRHKTVAVVGIGVSNEPLIRLLLQEGVAVTACDKRTREQLGKLAGELEARGARLQLGPDYLEGLDQDIIFRTPGLRPDVPQLAKAVAGGSELTSEMEVFFRVCPCPIIAVTGSDGKTTTTTIIAELLKKAGNTVHVGGNIGHPLLCEAGDMRPTDYAVLELSSFQLMTMPYSPHIAVVTNLAPNHLDVHKDMAEYVAAKENIFRHQKPGDKAIFNFDNDITRQQGESVPDRAISSCRAFTMWRTTWRPSPPWTVWCRMRPSGTLPANSAAWSTVSSWCAPTRACGTITIPSLPAPAAPRRACAPSRRR